MSIRLATEKDVSRIADLVASLAPYYLDESLKELPLWFSDSLSASAFSVRISSSEYMNFVFEEAGAIAGYISLKGKSHLYHLFVSKEYQGKGIARLLWQHAKECSQANSFFLRSSLYAVPIYKRFGFVESGPPGTKDGISFQPMELQIKC